MAVLVPSGIHLQEEKELGSEYQLGPSLACQPKTPTSECLFPSLSHGKWHFIKIDKPYYWLKSYGQKVQILAKATFWP